MGAIRRAARWAAVGVVMLGLWCAGCAFSGQASRDGAGGGVMTGIGF